MEAIAESVLEKQRDYLESRFDQLQQMGKDTEGKLGAIQTHFNVFVWEHQNYKYRDGENTIGC